MDFFFFLRLESSYKKNSLFYKYLYNSTYYKTWNHLDSIYTFKCICKIVFTQALKNIALYFIQSN